MEQLNKIYCAQCHLRERLSELLDNPVFYDLNNSIAETIEEADAQIQFTEHAYRLMGSKHSFKRCANFLVILEDDFNQVQSAVNDTRLRDISLLSYVQNIQHITISAFERILYSHSKLAEYMAALPGNLSVMPGEALKQLMLNRIKAASM